MTKRDFQNWDPVKELGPMEELLNREREECLRIAKSELMNTCSLTSYPPQSAAAFAIIQKIKDRIKK